MPTYGWFKVHKPLFDKEWARALGINALAVYVCLLRYEHNEYKMAWPSQRIVAQRLGVSEKTVMRSIKKLKEFGIITVEKDLHGGGGWKHNNYIFNLPGFWSREAKEKYLDRLVEMPNGDSVEVNESSIVLTHSPIIENESMNKKE